VWHITSANDVECLEDLKKLLSYLPQSNKETTAKLPYELNDEVEQLATIIPDNPNKPYDMHGVIAGIIDEDSFMCIRIMLKILLWALPD
jgi:propionyl-CoA carboxylase beta chain